MSRLRTFAASARDAALQARFRLWAAHLDVELRRRGGRLVLDAPHGLRFDAPPHLKAVMPREEVSVCYGSVVHCTERIELHDFVGTGERVTMIDSEKRHDGSDTHFLRQPLRVEPVVVGRNTFVAANAVITHGSRIGPNAVVAAGPVLTGGDYPGGHTLAGAPAKPVRQLP